jgi:hypothetical protein
MTAAPAPLGFRRGRLYLAAETYERYFPGIGTVILLRRERDLLVLPVRHAAAGGYVMKQRNAAGDRVIDGADFFRDHGLGENIEWHGEHGWCEASGGLRL